MPDFKTPIYPWHLKNNAKMAPFAGWDMPIQYAEGILAEHLHTREFASIFDICHMAQFIIAGEGVKELLAKAVSHNLETLAIGKCRYGFLLTEKGSVIDDLIIYRLAGQAFFLVVNAACHAVDFQTLTDRVGRENIFDISAKSGKIDLQGPKSLEVLEKIFKQDFHHLKYFSFVEISYLGQKILVSRTGYTGELGYELYCPRDFALDLWSELAGMDMVKPAGLGARDTLRLESGLSLYGHELDLEHTVAESGLKSMLTSEADYVGKALAKEVISETLIPLKLDGRRAARHGDLVFVENKEEAIGRVTSGSFAPSLGYAIAFAFIDKAYQEHENFVLKAGRSEIMAQKTSLPFYTKGTARMKFND